MSLIHRHKKCLGLTLFKCFRLHIEIWVCPAGFQIEPHSHPDEDIELMYLFGKTTFYLISDRNMCKFQPKWYHFGRCYSVPAGAEHWFIVSKWPLLFINFGKFKRGIKPTSAAINFQKT